jgi:class 3 adenylate cyclase/tetratricopeptide (TPR) repeat protein
VTVCPSCGQENPEGFRFCGACAASLEATPAREERKVITALFCDLVGSTAQGERLDPEDLQALLSRYHASVRVELERFGGTVEKFIGDAVVALFGAPLAREDDPERAVRAALAVTEWVAEQPDLHVRIAVNTGEALVVLGARPARGEHLASGDVLNTAARLQAAAPVDGILVGEQTFRATDRVIEYREHEPVPAKGKAKPVRVWEVVQARSRLGVNVELAPSSALVGREGELRLLREAFERAREEREPQLVTLVGVPGIGKSRLVYEFSRILDEQPELVTWRQGRCLPYGDGVSFWALGEMVKAHAGILESDGSEAVEAKLAATVTGLVSGADADWVLRWLRPLVGRGGEERSHGARPESFPAWRRFLESIAEAGPTVLVFEDLHWADEGLLDFLDELAEWTTGVPLLVLSTARPELLARRSGWGGGRTNTLTLSLSPLSGEETAQLVHDLLKRAALPGELQQALLERAGGIPLFAEEFARMVSDRGTADLAVPESVHGIIASRIDALVPQHKRLLQDAAVVGTVFWAGAVASLDGVPTDGLVRELRELERRELIRRERKSSVEGEVEYAFRHVLIRDVAYGQIPRAERSHRHRCAAEWIGSLGRPEDHAELLAHHYLEALEYARATGGDVTAFAQPGLTALSEAGERAMALGAYGAAARYWKAALELLGEDDPQRAGMLYRYGAALFWGEIRGEDVLEEAVNRLRPFDRETAARAALLLSRVAWLHADHSEVARWLAEVDELLIDRPESMVQTEALVVRSGFAMVAGDYDPAIRLAREALGRIEGLDRPDLHARAFDVIGVSRVSLGDEQGIDDQRRAIEIARTGRAIWELHHAMNNRGVSLVEFGFLRALEQNLEERRQAWKEIGGTADTRAWFLVAEATAEHCAGRWEAALMHTDEFLAGRADGATHYLESDCLSMRALIYLARDHTRQARADAERALEVAGQSGDPQVVVGSYLTRAYLRLAEGQIAAALADFEALLAVGDKLAAGLNIVAGLPAFVWLAIDLGRVEDAKDVVGVCRAPRWAAVGRAILASDPATAADLLNEIGHLPAEAYAHLRAGGDHLQRALSFYRSVGATRYIRQAESQLAASA